MIMERRHPYQGSRTLQINYSGSLQLKPGVIPPQRVQCMPELSPTHTAPLPSGKVPRTYTFVSFLSSLFIRQYLLPSSSFQSERPTFKFSGFCCALLLSPGITYESCTKVPPIMNLTCTCRFIYCICS